MNAQSSSVGIALSGVTKTFKTGVTAIDDVSMTIEPGEFVTFLGPSGSGKTTTLNTIAGFTRPTAGRVEIGGVDVTRVPTNRRNLGMVFQNYALFPHMSVRGNVSFGLKRRGLSRSEIERQVDAALERVRLTGFADRKPRQLSGGQQQRVALARAIVYDPPVLLMDEPLGALDKNLRTEMQAEIARLHRELGTTFLFVTHDQDEALALSDRIALFDRGRVVQLGTPAELYQTPTSLFAAEFVGDSNVFKGKLTADGTHLSFAGDCLRIVDTGGCQPGGEAAVVVRPERMSILSDTVKGAEGHNVLSALVADVAYAGSFRRIRLRYADGAIGVIAESGAADSTLRVGDAVHVSWDPRFGAVVELGGR